MIISEILEGVVSAWGRTPKGKMVRKYRCTSGPKKGRVVAKPSTCTTAIGGKASANLKRTRSGRSAIQAIKRAFTMTRPTSRRIQKANRSPKFKRLNRRKKLR